MALERVVGRHFHVLRLYRALNNTTLRGAAAQEMKSRGQPMYLNITSEMGRRCVSWRSVAAGRYNSQLHSIARQVRRYRYRVYFSWNHEMQGNCSTGTAADYRASYKRVRQGVQGRARHERRVGVGRRGGQHEPRSRQGGEIPAAARRPDRRRRLQPGRRVALGEGDLRRGAPVRRQPRDPALHRRGRVRRGSVRLDREGALDLKGVRHVQDVERRGRRLDEHAAQRRATTGSTRRRLRSPPTSRRARCPSTSARRPARGARRRGRAACRAGASSPRRGGRPGRRCGPGAPCRGRSAPGSRGRRARRPPRRRR